MKRMLFGVLWFFLFLLLFTVIALVVIGTSISAMYHPIGVQAGVKAGTEFAKNHYILINVYRVGVVLSAAILSVVLTSKGALPGTASEDQKLIKAYRDGR